jgi:hypothetical protein
VGTVLGLVVGEIADVVYNDVDMVLPPGPSTISRGVASHEYGHYTFCDMMYRTDPGKFSSACVNAASDTIVTQMLHRDGSLVPDDYLNEGIADDPAHPTWSLRPDLTCDKVHPTRQATAKSRRPFPSTSSIELRPGRLTPGLIPPLR